MTNTTLGTMTVREYLERTFEPNNEFTTRDAVVCEDGFKVSVQGGTRTHYCSPREHCNTYHQVELGFPSEEVSEWMEYAGPTQTVYAWVPLEVVESVIQQHGGMVNALPEAK